MCFLSVLHYRYVRYLAGNSSFHRILVTYRGVRKMCTAQHALLLNAITFFFPHALPN